MLELYLYSPDLVSNLETCFVVNLATVELPPNKSLQRTFDPPPIFAAAKRPSPQAPLNLGVKRFHTG